MTMAETEGRYKQKITTNVNRGCYLIFLPELKDLAANDAGDMEIRSYQLPCSPDNVVVH